MDNTRGKRISTVAGLAILSLCFASPGHSADRSLTTVQANDFVRRLIQAVNAGSPAETEKFLHLNTAESAVFHNNITSGSVAYAQPASLSPGQTLWSSFEAGKFDSIQRAMFKKKTIPGYMQDAQIRAVDILENGRYAAVEMNLNEYSNQKIWAESRCTLFLTRSSYKILIAQMDCNTVQNTDSTGQPFTP